ncbi:MAG: hypothetical protein HY264_01820 [Chloroflexi bacterium]|nr:hypothetical protein [Chloroflexota bacterium]
MTRPDLLPPGGNERLERFAAEFERLDAGAYATFATNAEGDAEVDAAMAAAVAILGEGPQRAAVREAVATFRDWAAQAYSSRLVQTDTLLLFQSLADRAEDRVRFAASLERAVVALILWDELEPPVRLALLGPWETMVERAAVP